MPREENVTENKDCTDKYCTEKLRVMMTEKMKLTNQSQGYSLQIIQTATCQSDEKKNQIIKVEMGGEKWRQQVDSSSFQKVLK